MSEQAEKKYIAKRAFCLNCQDESTDIEQKFGRLIDGAKCPICGTNSLISQKTFLDLQYEDQ